MLYRPLPLLIPVGQRQAVPLALRAQVHFRNLIAFRLSYETFPPADKTPAAVKVGRAPLLAQTNGTRRA